jgi:hypothetical protein
LDEDVPAWGDNPIGIPGLAGVMAGRGYIVTSAGPAGPHRTAGPNPPHRVDEAVDVGHQSTIRIV